MYLKYYQILKIMKGIPLIHEQKSSRYFYPSFSSLPIPIRGIVHLVDPMWFRHYLKNPKYRLDLVQDKLDSYILLTCRTKTSYVSMLLVQLTGELMISLSSIIKTLLI